MKHSVSTQWKRLLTYIYNQKKKLYIDKNEGEWDIARYLGDIMLYIGFILLLIDYFILNHNNIYTYGTLKHLPDFIINPHMSKIKICNTSQAWLLFILLGTTLSILGECFTTKPPNKNTLTYKIRRKIINR